MSVSFEEYRRAVDALKRELDNSQVSPTVLLDSADVSAFVRYGWFLRRALDVLRGIQRDDPLERQKRRLARFIRKYRKARQSSATRPLEFTTDARLGQGPTWAPVGYIPDPDYEVRLANALALYHAQSEQYEARKRYAEAEHDRLLNTEQGRRYTAIKQKYDAAQCPFCGGSGRHGTGQSGIGDVPCDFEGPSLDLNEEEWNILRDFPNSLPPIPSAWDAPRRATISKSIEVFARLR